MTITNKYCDICGWHITCYERAMKIKYKAKYRRNLCGEWIKADICSHCLNEIERQVEQKRKKEDD